MLRLKPVSEDNASDQVKNVYQDIKATLDSQVVPLVFQYIANFEEYFVYQWGKIKKNIESPYFPEVVKEAVEFSNKEVTSIYSPSSKMSHFIHGLHAAEKEQIHKTIMDLQQLNAKLLVLIIGLREGVKGVIIGQDQVLQLDVKQYEVDIFDLFHTKYAQESEIEPASRMLAPLFGNQSLVISHYPAFFSTVAEEMEQLIRREDYLWKRVELERVAMREAFGLPYSLGTSYPEIMTYAGHKSHLNELIYILAETFPTQFPRLLMTTSVMQIALEGKIPLTTR
jgi:hypothetical protein